MFFICANFALGQIRFSEEGKEVSSPSVLLEFDDSATNIKGLLLPTVTSLTETSVAGTLLYDLEDFNFKIRTQEQWEDLTPPQRSISTYIELSEGSDKHEAAGMIIGDETDESIGILVLATSDKAMVLPKITDPEMNVPYPYPGMICFDTTTKMLAMFDGNEWNYWE